MTPSEADKLFKQITSATASNDHEKLSNLMESDAPEPAKPEDEEQPNLDQPEPEKDTPEPKVEEEEEEVETSPPGAKPADEPSDEEDEPKEPNELDTLKQQLESLKKENHSLKSQAGRVPHVQKRLSELDKKLAELTKQSPSSQTSEKINPKIEAALKKVAGDDPELAAAIRESLEAAVNGVAEEAHAKEIATLQFLRAQESSAHEAAEAQRLLEMHPNAPDVLRSKHWSDWVSAQSPAMKALVESNSADDLSFAFGRYALDMHRLHPDLAKPAATTEPAKTDQAAKIEEERAKRKQNAADVSGKPAATTKQPEDAEALFKKYSAQAEKELGYKR